MTVVNDTSGYMGRSHKEGGRGDMWYIRTSVWLVVVQLAAHTVIQQGQLYVSDTSNFFTLELSKPSTIVIQTKNQQKWQVNESRCYEMKIKESMLPSPSTATP